MIVDVEQTPILGTVEILGHLSFDDSIDIHFRALNIFVRGGMLMAGTSENPFSHNLLIELIGPRDAETIAISNDIYGGNKAIINIGTVIMHGMPRT